MSFFCQFVSYPLTLSPEPYTLFYFTLVHVSVRPRREMPM